MHIPKFILVAEATAQAQKLDCQPDIAINNHIRWESLLHSPGLLSPQEAFASKPNCIPVLAATMEHAWEHV